MLLLQDGFVFRLQVAHAREISLLKQTVNAQGQLRYKDNAASMALERSTVHLPKLTATLHGYVVIFFFRIKNMHN
jgi:hypothetical protein